MMFTLLCGAVAASTSFRVKERRFTIDNSVFAKLHETPLVFNITFPAQQLYVGDEVTVEASTFQECVSGRNMWQEGTGGGIFAQNTKLTVNDCAFVKCIAQFAGAAMLVHADTTMDHCTFDRGLALVDVGAVWSIVIEADPPDPRQYLRLYNGNFSENSAKEYYGALASNYTHPVIRDCHFRNNHAGISVGGLGISGRNYMSTNFRSVDVINNSCDVLDSMSCAGLWLQGCSEWMSFTAMLDNTYFGQNRVLNGDRRSIVTFNRVDVVMRGWNCFDGPSTEMFSAVIGMVVLMTPNAHFEIPELAECRVLYPTGRFSPSSRFTQSSAFDATPGFSATEGFTETISFTETTGFTETKEFTGSDSFAATTYFTLSSGFTYTKAFSDTGDFSESIGFTETQGFSASEGFIPTTGFSETQSFTMTSAFTRTKAFSETSPLSPSSDFAPSSTFPTSVPFSESDSFSPSPTFTPTETFTQSSAFSASNSFGPSPTPTFPVSESESESDETKEEKKLNVPALAGGLSLLLLLLLLLLILCCCCKKKRSCCCCCKKKQKVEIKAPILKVPKDKEHDDSFVIFVNALRGFRDSLRPDRADREMDELSA